MSENDRMERLEARVARLEELLGQPVGQRGSGAAISRAAGQQGSKAGTIAEHIQGT
jgi:hypothetical protein